MEQIIKQQIATNNTASLLSDRDMTLPNMHLVDSIANIIDTDSSTHLQIARDCNLR
jgi:hypothetical protein